MTDVQSEPTITAPSAWVRSAVISLVAAMGGLLFGYDWIVISGAKPFFQAYFNITNPDTIGWAMSCALLGALAGATTSGYVADRWGRKKLLIASGLLFAASSLGTGWAASFGMFIFWRLAGGVAIGIASNLSPLYIAETAPAHLRGRLVAINQLTIVIGILLADVINWMIARPVAPHATAAIIAASWNGRYGWRLMFTIVAAPAILLFIAAWFIPESPRWLAARGRMTAARRALEQLRGSASNEEFASLRASSGQHTASVPLASLFSRRMMPVIVMGVVLAVLQQWCGINVIFSYAQNVFSDAGYHVNGVLFNIMITGSVNLVFTIIAMALVDRLGRRALMLMGAGGLVMTHLALGYLFYVHVHGLLVVCLVMAAIACYAMTLAPVTWVLISEIFPSEIRATAVSLAVSALWLADFILTQTYPLLEARVGASGAFWLYAGVCLAGFLYILRVVPETKGRSLEQLSDMLCYNGSRNKA